MFVNGYSLEDTVVLEGLFPISLQIQNARVVYIYILAFFKVSLMMVFDRFNNGGYEWGTDVPVNLYIYHQ